MSSLIDAIIASDPLALNSEQGAGSGGLNSTASRRPTQRSSSRPRGPPSESYGHRSDDEGFPDDEIVGARGTVKGRPKNLLDRAVPRVVDVTGETVQQNFEEFLEE